MITRRHFLAALSALPFVGKLVPQKAEPSYHLKIEMYYAVRDEFITVPWRRALWSEIGRDSLEAIRRTGQERTFYLDKGSFRVSRTTDETWAYNPSA